MASLVAQKAANEPFFHQGNLAIFFFFVRHTHWVGLTDGGMVAGFATMEILYHIRVVSKTKGQRVNSSYCNMFSTVEPHPCD